ncbi:MAG: YraN family protein [Paracoccaceae bacterium]
MSGAVSYHAGLAAEAQVAADYVRRGYAMCQQRWRSQGGEIDLIARDGDGYIFVEVKKSRNFARAVERLSQRQLQRIYNAANEFIGQMPLGLNTPARIDVALVDASGQIEIIENAYGH